MEKSLIDFTKGGNFKTFNKDVMKHLLKSKFNKNVFITDYIYPLQDLDKNIYEIKDHINLSGFNPLSGPNFISLTNIYSSKTGIIVCGLKDGVQPNIKEKRILLKGRVKAYCYNLVPTVIFAASLGLKIKATGIICRL